MAIKKKRLILLDSHAILHRAFHALPGFTSPVGEPTGALYGFTSMLLKIIKDLKPDYLAACFDLPEPTFRHLVYDKYKAKRPKMDDDLGPQIDKSKKILRAFEIPIYEKAGFEADDVLGTIVSQNGGKGLELIVVTGDMDTLQLVKPGVRVFAMKKGIKESVFYDKVAVKERYGFEPKLLTDFKGLMGDPSDNIMGVPGVGEKTAKTLIHNFGSLEKIYKKLKKDTEVFKAVGITPRIIKILEENEEEAFFSKALAEIRTDVPISFSIDDAKWDSSYDEEKVKEIFSEFGFRSLTQRIETKTEISLETKVLSKKAELAFWLLDSRRTNPKVEDVLDFVKTDSLGKAEIYLEDLLKKRNMYGLLKDMELPLSEILSRMEKTGILLDVNYLKELSKEYHKKLKEIQKKIWGFAGEEFNVNSPKQVAEILFNKMRISTKGVRKTSQGAYSTRFSELEKIRDRHPIVQEIFANRELAKLTSTYVDNLPDFVDKNKRLHTTFNQTGTSTGRLSSSDPNLQNIPTRSSFGLAVRKAFVAPKGRSLVSFDYSQIELRVAASLSDDKKFIHAFISGRDIHNEVASEVFNVSFEKVDIEMRRRAKIINFGILYGIGINSLKKNLGCSKEEAESFYQEYFKDFSGLASYLEEIKIRVREKGYTETLFGRRRYLPEINSPIVFIRKEAERMAVNAPIQGTAADIIKMAMIGVNKLFSQKRFSENANLLLQVHDDLLFEVDSGFVKEFVVDVKKIMESIDLPKVPLVVESYSGPNWADMVKI